MLDIYMNPARMLKGYKANPADTRAIELVSSVETMIEEGRPVTAELHALADVMEKKAKEIIEARAAARVKLEDASSRWMKGGYPDLARYKEKNGSGMHLFRAYLNRRKADRQQDETRKGLLKAKRAEAERGRGKLTEDEAVELLKLDILAALDPVIADVLKVCEKGKLDSNKALSELRSALRIGRGKSQYDAVLDKKRHAAIYLWLRAFTDSTTVFRSPSATATVIAKELKISKRTALNYLAREVRLEKGQRKNPVLEHIAGEAASRARGGVGTPKGKGRLARHQKFRYGKGKRANQ